MKAARSAAIATVNTGSKFEVTSIAVVALARAGAATALMLLSLRAVEIAGLAVRFTGFVLICRSGTGSAFNRARATCGRACRARRACLNACLAFILPNGARATLPGIG